MAIRTPSPNLGISLCDFGGSGRDKHSLVLVSSKVCVVQENSGFWACLCHPPLTLPFLGHTDRNTHFACLSYSVMKDN